MIQHLQKLVSTGEQLYAKVCTVHSVDKENKCCDVVPIDGTAELFDIPFQADVQGTGLCLYPAKDSKVLVVFINKHNACICNVSEVDLMKLAIDKMDFSVDKDQFMIKNEEMEFAVDKDGLSIKKGGAAFSVAQNGFQLKTETESLKKLMDDLLDAIQAMIFTTPGGLTPAPTTALLNTSTFAALKTRFNTFLKV